MLIQIAAFIRFMLTSLQRFSLGGQSSSPYALDVFIIFMVSGTFLVLSHVFMEKGFDSIVDSSETFVGIPEFGRISIDTHKFIFVSQFSVVDLICVKIFG